jgi:hypothetical protein
MLLIQPVKWGLALSVILTAFAAMPATGADGSRIPDAPRTWTHRDGRAAELRFVERDGDTVCFQDVNRMFAYRVPFAQLSEQDQAHIHAMTDDGSRVWTHRDGRSRRLRLVECDGETAFFEIPNLGPGTTPVSDFVESDQKLLRQAANTSAGRERIQLVSTALVQVPEDRPAAGPLPDAQAVRGAIEEAFRNPELRQELASIGSDPRFDVASRGDGRFVVTVTFQQLALPEADAQQRLSQMRDRLMPQITQMLNIREADIADFHLDFVLAQQGVAQQAGAQQFKQLPPEFIPGGSLEVPAAPIYPMYMGEDGWGCSPCVGYRAPHCRLVGFLRCRRCCWE